MASRGYYNENEERPAGHHQRGPEDRYDREGGTRADRDRYESDRVNEFESNRPEREYESDTRGGGYSRRDDADGRRDDSYQRHGDSYQRRDEDYDRRGEGFRQEGQGFGRGSGGHTLDDDYSREESHHGGQRRDEGRFGDQRPQGRFDEEGSSRYDSRNPNDLRTNDNYPSRNQYDSPDYRKDSREDGSQHDSYGSDRPTERFGRSDHGDQGGYQGSGPYEGQHGGSTGDGELFSNTLDSLSGHRQRLQNESLNEGQAISAHQQMYGGGESGSAQAATSDSMGSAAAMQALKMFTGGQSSHQQGASAQESFIRMAMGEAAQLFDQQSAQGNAHPSANKQDAVSSAAQLALKMFMKSQSDGGGGGSGLMGLASKFLS